MSKVVKIDDWIYYEITTDDEPSIIQIKRQQAHYNDTEGNLYPVGFPEDDRIIGRWWNVNVEAEKWEHEAGLFRFALEENIKRLEMYKESHTHAVQEAKKWEAVASHLHYIVDHAVKTKLVVSKNEYVANALKMYEDAKGK